MNKIELVNSMAAKNGQSKKDTEAALEAFTKSVKEALRAEDKVTLVGFGSFDVRKRNARKGRNPHTNVEITIPATKAPVFKPGRDLKEKVNS